MAAFAFYTVQIAVQPGVARDAFVDALNDALADALPPAGLRNAEEPYFELRAGAVRTGIVRMQGDAWDCAAVLRAMADVSRRFEDQTFSFSFSCEGEAVLTLRDGHFGDSHEDVERFLEEYAPGDDGQSEIARPANFEVTEIAFEAELDADFDIGNDRAGEVRALSDLEARIRDDLSPAGLPGDREAVRRVHRSHASWPGTPLASAVRGGVLTRLQGAGMVPRAISRISLVGPQGARHYAVPSFFDWIPPCSSSRSAPSSSSSSPANAGYFRCPAIRRREPLVFSREAPPPSCATTTKRSSSRTTRERGARRP